MPVRPHARWLVAWSAVDSDSSYPLRSLGAFDGDAAALGCAAAIALGPIDCRRRLRLVVRAVAAACPSLLDVIAAVLGCLACTSR